MPRRRVIWVLGALAALGCGGEEGPAASDPPAAPPTEDRPSAAPEPAAPEPAEGDPPASGEREPTVPPLSCDAMARRGVAVFTMERRGSSGDRETAELTLRAGTVRGTMAARRFWAEVREVELNDDDLTDYYVSPGEEDGEGGVWTECGNFGECVTGVYAGCRPNGVAEVMADDYYFGLAVQDTAIEVDGRRWNDIGEVRRISGSQAEETDRLASGEETTHDFLWRMRGARYRLDGDDARGASNRCADRRRAGDLDEALVACRLALDRAETPELRGAAYYELARIAEARGDVTRARVFYRESLEARPDDAIVQARLEALER